MELSRMSHDLAFGLEKLKWIGLAFSYFGLRELQITLTGLIVIFTPKDSFWRRATIPLHLALGVAEYYSIDYNIIPGSPPSMNTYRGILTGGLVGTTIVCIAFQCMLRLDSVSLSSLSHQSTISGQLSWLSRLCANPRCIGTPYEAKNLPRFDEDNPTFVPSRSQILKSRVKGLVASYLLRDLLVTVVGPRIHHGLYWAIFNRLWLGFYQELGTVLAVGLLNDRVENWPPQFGSAWESNTVRAFWGKFWHQNLRFTLTTPANYICKDILRLPPGTRTQRYTNMLFVFAISALLHNIIDVRYGLNWYQSRAFPSFCIQVLGIMLEDGVIELWRRRTLGSPTSSKVNSTKPPIWIKILGYVWTWSFISITMGWYVMGYWDHFLAGNDVFYSFTGKFLEMTGSFSLATSGREL